MGETLKKLRESERMFSNLMNNFPGMVYRCRVDHDWTVEFVSKGVYGLTGYNVEDLTNNKKITLNDLVHPDDREQVREKIHAALDDWESYSITYRLIPASGDQKWVLERGSAVYTEKKEPVAIEGFVTDITEQKRYVEQLHLQSQALHSTANAIVITDKGGVIEWVNPAFSTLTGYPFEEVVGQHTRIFRSGAQDSSYYKELWDTVLRGEVWRGELLNKRKDGSIYNEEQTITPVRDPDGTISRFIAIKEDVTEKRKFEQQMIRTQRMESIGNLAGGVAHDLNNVLTPIMMSIEMIREKIHDAKTANLLDTLDKGARRGSEIIKQLLSFARGIEGRHNNFQARHLIRDIQKLIEQTFPKSVTLKTDLPGDLWLISGDVSQIQQVILNLCLNAKDAMPEGGALEITARNVTLDQQFTMIDMVAQSGDYVRISVSDTGSGMSSEVLEHIYEPFFTTKEEGRGTGLGLTMVNNIVKSHNGFVNVYSEEGRGTVFKIYFPAVKEELDESVVQQGEDISHGNGKLILVVDDDEAIRIITQTTLEKHGYRTITAEDGLRAIAEFRKRMTEISLIIMDIRMPNMDGFQAITEIKKIRPDVRIIAVSGLLRDESEIKDDVKMFIHKPYTAKVLLDSIERVLGI